MPLFSAFTPFGMLEYSSKPSPAESTYHSMVKNLGGEDDNYSLAIGTYQEAKIYAQAMGIGRLLCTARRAGNQIDPTKVTDMLPVSERDWGVIVGESDTFDQRRAALLAAELVPRGASRVNIESALRALLGDDFLAYRTLTPSEAVNYPLTPGTGPGLFTRPEIPTKLLKLTESMGDIDAPSWIYYANLDSSAADLTVSVGEKFTVQPENWARAEKITVLDARGTGATRELYAQFNKAHDDGATMTNGSCPMWVGIQRFALIVVTAAASVDAEKQRKIHALMSKIDRGVGQWMIVQPTTPGANTVGPITIGITPIGVATFASLAF